ncbi:MAG TPA: hypothetical protein VHX38_35765 [Pseudonocardiaceae bacterium]|jgi:hypothetical protein|nr:hypothetical protein [Pseudonocardiaceae bacterium]
MTVIESTWTEFRATNRRVQDACLRMLAALPMAYGSPEWEALPNDHPEKYRAMRRAAEAWRRYWQPEAVSTRRDAEQDRIDRAACAQLRAVSHNVSEAADWHAIGRGPTWRELQRRRYPWLYDPDWQSPAEISRGRDYPGYLPAQFPTTTGQEAA